MRLWKAVMNKVWPISDIQSNRLTTKTLKCFMKNKQAWINYKSRKKNRYLKSFYNSMKMIQTKAILSRQTHNRKKNLTVLMDNQLSPINHQCLKSKVL